MSCFKTSLYFFDTVGNIIKQLLLQILILAPRRGGWKITGKTVEAYVGEYASGKSEVAVNRSIDLLKVGHVVTLVDLDLVEPFYTLRPIKRKLEEMGLHVLAWETGETMGLGEAGSVIKPEMRWALRREGDVILDIGYGVEGARTLNMIEGARESEDLRVFAVINISRPMTGSVPDIIEYVRELGRIDGLINNTHLGDETTSEVVQEGARVVAEAARDLALPVIATCIERRLAGEFGDRDIAGNPVRLLDRYMMDTFW
jgi:hypothetical protein